MYNLLIGPMESYLPKSRLLHEGTDDHLKQYLTQLNTQGASEPKLDKLLNLPTLLMPEAGWHHYEQVARIGHVSTLTRNRMSSTFTFTFKANPATAPIPVEHIEKAAALLEIAEWEFTRTHWAVKDVDLYRILDEHVPGVRPRPEVFDIPLHATPESDLVAVMMPFDNAFSPVYEAMKEGIEAAGMRCLRADDVWEKDHVLDDVLSLIWRSRVVLADLSGKNPNVFYEVGIAHSLGRRTILVAQSMDDVPFDLRALRVLHYENNEEGRHQLTQAITDRLRTLMTM